MLKTTKIIIYSIPYSMNMNQPIKFSALAIKYIQQKEIRMLYVYYVFII